MLKDRKETEIKQNEKQQISNGQLVLLLAAFLFGGQQIFSPVEQGMAHNQWFTTLSSAVLGFFLISIYLTICKLFPDKNFSQILTAVFGKVLGKIFSLVYTVLFLFATGFSLLLMANFWIDLDTWYTPQLVVMFLVLIAAALGAYFGLEVLARASVIVISLLLAIAFLDTVFVIPEMKFSYLLPLQEIDGTVWLKSLKYMLMLEYFNLLMFVIPGVHTEGKGNSGKSIRFWMVFVLLYLVFIDIRSALVLGPATYLFDYPSTHVLKVIDLVGILPQVELLGIMALIAGGILRITYMFYIFLEMVNHTFAMREKRVLILPLVLLTLASAFFFIGFSEGIQQQLDFYFSWIGIPFYLVIPLLLVFVGLYQKHKRQKRSAVGRL